MILQKNGNSDSYSSNTILHKEALIIQELKKRGLKITNQRKLILEIILSNKCASCKEIYYQAALRDSTIGIATVYRLVRMLEEMGIIDRKKLFQITYDSLSGVLADQVIMIDEENTFELVPGQWYELLKRTLKDRKLIDHHEISVIIKRTKSVGREAI
jgi:Fur family ferric uptake transcriptional regulator